MAKAENGVSSTKSEWKIAREEVICALDDLPGGDVSKDEEQRLLIAVEDAIRIAR